MFHKTTIRCDQCGRPVTRKRFINKILYLEKEQRLVKIIGKSASEAGCLNCLKILEAREGDQIEKIEFSNRTIYTLRPTFGDTVKKYFSDFLNLKPKTKERSHEQSK